jgi:ABC-type nitrate/sulfonate/bicarbonate transport system ATPase subunit
MRCSNRSNALPTAGGAESDRPAATGGAMDTPAAPVAERPSLAAIRIAAKSFADPVTGERRLVLDRIEIDLLAEEIVAIVGPSGCGKTTLLQLIAGLDTDFQGTIRWPGSADGQRPRLGYVFQNPRLLPWLSLRKNIELVLDAPVRHRREVDALLDAMGLAESGATLANRLSVGMQRRAALARAFAVQPRVLLMDEPFVSLDAPTAEQLRQLLLDTWDQHRPTLVFVTHDLREAVQLADRILFLSANPARLLDQINVGVPRGERLTGKHCEERYSELLRHFNRLYARRVN